MEVELVVPKEEKPGEAEAEAAEPGERDEGEIEVENEGMTSEEPALIIDAIGDAAIAMLEDDEENKLKKELEQLNQQIKEIEVKDDIHHSYWEEEKQIVIEDPKIQGDVNLISKSQQKFQLSRVNTSLSRYIKSSGEDTFLVPTNSNILGIVVKYLEHHQGKIPRKIDKPIRSLKIKNICYDKWDALLVEKLAPRILLQLVVCAEFLSIEPLMDLVSAMIAIHIKGKTAKEITQFFGVERLSKEVEKKKVYL